MECGAAVQIFYNYLASAELYNPGQGRFISLSSTSTGQNAGSNGSAVLLANGKVLIAGGVDADVIVANARLYDPVERKFLLASSITSERTGHQTTLLRNGQVLVTGGIKTVHWSASPALATAELFDPEQGRFSRLPDMMTLRTGHSATLLRNGEVLIAGGIRGSFISLSSAELFRPALIVKQTSAKASTNQSLN